MSFGFVWMLVVAGVVAVAAVLGYLALQRQRSRALTAIGVKPPGGFKRHLPPLLFLAALIFLFVGVARPQATVPVPRASGTVILAFDISNSMKADDIAPSRLAAAQQAAIGFVRSQPDTVDIGVVAFGQGAMTTQLPTNNRESTVSAINRLTIAGGTSLGQAILGSMTAITGEQVGLPKEGEQPADLGYWSSATIVVLSDGEDTGGPDAVAAAEIAAGAGVHIETIGVGTAAGATVEIDGFQVATSLNEDLLTQVAQTAAGSYHRAENAEALNEVYASLDLRTTVSDELVDLSWVALGAGLLLLTIGGILMITWYGRIV